MQYPNIELRVCSQSQSLVLSTPPSGKLLIQLTYVNGITRSEEWGVVLYSEKISTG